MATIRRPLNWQSGNPEVFAKVLVANRGAIAVRIMRTLRDLGIVAVAIYADEDRDSLHIQAADEAYSLGSGSAADTYLNQEKILSIIERSGVQAVHPGYGFLSENATFAERLAAHGIRFIGPQPEHLKQFGLKHEARRLAQASAVNLVPGSDILAHPEQALAAAAAIGYPVMLKSTAGGGGIGMQRCDSEQELTESFAAVSRLAQGNFGNAELFVEKLIRAPRHVEVQAFGDGRGNVAIIGDRDCSLQRRHQKVIEECPAPNIPDDVRKRLHDQARVLLQSVNYEITHSTFWKSIRGSRSSMVSPSWCTAWIWLRGWSGRQAARLSPYSNSITWRLLGTLCKPGCMPKIPTMIFVQPRE